jgi:hypothetical protein
MLITILVTLRAPFFNLNNKCIILIFINIVFPLLITLSLAGLIV